MSDAGPIYEAVSGKRRRVLSEIDIKTNNTFEFTENSEGTGSTGDCAASQKYKQHLDLDSNPTAGVPKHLLLKAENVEKGENSGRGNSRGENIDRFSGSIRPLLSLSKSDMNSQGSGIPTLRKNDRFERFLTINESLNRKSSIPGLNGESLKSATPPGFHMTLDPKVALSNKAREKLIQESRELDEEIRHATETLAYKQEEAYTLRKLHKALANEQLSLESAIEENRGKLEYLLDQVTSRVEAKEIEAQKQIEELHKKARDSYDNVRSEVKSELEKALQSESSESAQEVVLLEATKTELEAEVARRNGEKEEKIRVLKAQLQAETEAQKRSIREELATAVAQLKNLALQDTEVEKETLELEGSLSSQEKSNQNVRVKVALLESTIQQQNIQRADIQAQIDSETEKFAAQQALNAACAEKEDAARLLFDAEKQKYDAYVSTRRDLEHAISKLSEKKRILVRIGGDGASRGIDMKERFGGDLALGKITTHVMEDAGYSDEWRLLVQEALLGAHVSIMFMGSPQEDALKQILDVYSFLSSGLETYKENGWNFFYHLQSISVQEKHMCDLVDLSSQVKWRAANESLEISSTKMPIRSGSQIADVLESAFCLQGIYVHVVSVDCTNAGASKRVSGKVTLIDASRLSLQAQIDHLNYCIGSDGKEFSYMGEVFQQRRASFTSVDVCDIVDIQAPGATEFLDAIKSRAY